MSRNRAAYMREYRAKRKHPVREAKVVLDAEVERLTEENATLTEEVARLTRDLAARPTLIGDDTTRTNNATAVTNPYSAFRPAPKPGRK